MEFSQQVRRPLVGVALSMVAGLGVQYWLNLSPLLFLALSAVALACTCWRASRCGTLEIYLSCFLLAAAYGAIEQVRIPRHAVLPMAETAFGNQELVGTVIDDPLISEEDNTARFRFRVEAVCFDGQWRPADAVIQARISDPDMPAAYGERWRMDGWFLSYGSVRGGMSGAVYADGSGSHRIRQAPPSFRGACYKMRRRLSPLLCMGIEDFSEQIQLLQALLLGYRNALPYRLYQTFARTGTFHIFAISGLHVGVMAAILIAALKMLGVSRPRWGLFLIPLLFIYVVSTGMKPSAFRAFTMAAVYFAAPLAGRRPDPASAIALAAIILLLINPLQLVDPGFLLSFTVVSGIVMVHLFASHHFSGFRRPGWAAPLAQLSGPRPVLILLRTIGLLALTSAAAWIFSAPLTARFFNTFSPVALIGNLTIIPLTFVIVLTGCLSLLTSPFFIPAAVIFNHANRIFISLLINIIQHLGALPGAYRFVWAPSLMVLALWYGGLALFFAGPKRLRRSGLLAVLCAGVLWLSGAPESQSGIGVLRRGNTCVLVQVQNRHLLLTDGSSYSMAATARMLRERGINRAQALAVNGAQIDVDAVRELCDTYFVQQLFLSPGLENTPEADALLRAGINIFFSGDPHWNAGAGIISVNWE